MPTPGLLKTKHKSSTNKETTRFVCETQIPPIMASSKDDQDQNTNILKAVDKMLLCFMKTIKKN